ncbi:hypothetical protein ACLKA6_003282 [Drosophila palustris]
MFERGERTANTTSRTPQRRAWETTLDGQGAVQGILWCSAGSKNYGELVGKRPHDAFSCPKNPLEGAVCANCRGNHVATYPACPARERARIKREMDEFAAGARRILRLLGTPTQAGYVGGLLVDEELRGELGQLVAYIERVERAMRLTRPPAVAAAAPPEAAHPPGQG